MPPRLTMPSQASAYWPDPVSVQLRQMNQRLDDVLIAIARLQMKEHNAMSDLSDAVAAVASKVDALAAELQTVKTDAEAVIALLQQPAPDVGAAVTALQDIATKADAAMGTAKDTASELEAAAPAVHAANPSAPAP